MKYRQINVLFLTLALYASCGGQSESDHAEERKSEVKEVSTFRWIDTTYEYADANGRRLVIQNSLPRGGPFTDANGKEYFKVIFWTRWINETDKHLELKIDFPADSFEVPWLAGKYYKVLVPPDTMRINRGALYDYGLTGLQHFLNNNVPWSSSLHRTIKPKGSTGFYVAIFCRKNEGAPGAMRTGFSIQGQEVFYTISLDKGPPHARTKEIEIHCGSISLKDLVLRK